MFSIARCGEVVSDLVPGDRARRSDRPQQRGRERARPDARLEDARAREDVGEHEDRPDVLRVDHLRAARHLEDVLGERRPQRGQACAAGGAHCAAVGVADDVVVGDDAGVRMELAARLEHDEVPATTVVDEEHPLAGGEHAGSYRAGPHG